MANVSVTVDFDSDECGVEVWGLRYADDDVQVESIDGGRAMCLSGEATSVWAALVVWAGGDEDAASEAMNDAT